MRRTSIRRPKQLSVRFSVLAVPEENPRSAAHWKINGYPAQILIWTVEEWERLAIRPADARYHPSGVWCALRMQ